MDVECGTREGMENDFDDFNVFNDLNEPRSFGALLRRKNEQIGH